MSIHTCMRVYTHTYTYATLYFRYRRDFKTNHIIIYYIHSLVIEYIIHYCIQFNVGTYTHMHSQAHIHMYAHTYTCMRTQVHIHTYARTYAHIHTYAHIYTHTHAHTHIHIHNYEVVYSINI